MVNLASPFFKGLHALEYSYPALNVLRRTYAHLTEGYRIAHSVKRKTDELKKEFGARPDQVQLVYHHLSHGYAAYYSSPFNKEDALVLTLDGQGDGLCATVNTVEKGHYRTISTTPLYHSLGFLYLAITEFMGMKGNEHEYKIMGLAPYAEQKGSERVYNLLKELVFINKKDPLAFDSKIAIELSPRYLRDNFYRLRFDWIAGGIQRLAEELITTWVRNAIKKTGLSTVVLGGGVFMNVKANMLVGELPEVKKLWVMPSCGDESSVFGACYRAYLKENPSRRIDPLGPLYLGPSYSDEHIEAVIRGKKLRRKYEVQELGKDQAGEIAELLKTNVVVARFSGRQEYGARALGNRSILANPSNYGVVREINEQIKSRDFWMPFAPSVLAESADDYLVNPKRISAPYMIMAFKTKPRAHKEITAALHPYDLSARPQVVQKEWNPAYHAIIREFESCTGIGAVLNTSFNLHGQPIVDSPQDAVYTFENSGLPALVVGNFLIRKK